MRTIEEAIAEESRRYLQLCVAQAKYQVWKRTNETDDLLEALSALLARKAHIHALALRRLRHRVVTEHEALKLSAGA